MKNDEITDVIMIGAGPSALAAAVYTTREDIKTTLFEKGAVGGLAAITDQIDNYPGFSKGVSGLDLATELEAQAKRFGAAIQYGEVTEIRDDGDYRVVVANGQEHKTRAVLIATGSDYKKIGVPGEAEFYGRGVHYCATCDGAFYRDKTLAVVGGGNSGVQEALFLTRFAKKIHLLVRSQIKASEVLQRDLQKYIDSGQIEVHLNTVTDEIVTEDNKVVGVAVTENGEKTTITVDGVFIFIGLSPNTGFLKTSAVELDEIGLIKTDAHLMTSVNGVFASGDVRSGATAQIATAVGEGATAALKIREFLEELERAK